MANVDRQCGFTPVRHLNGMPWNGKARMYSVPVGNAAAIFVGDAVASTGSADSTGKYPGIVIAATTAAVRGVVIGFSDQPYVNFDTSNLYRNYCPATTAMYALVVDDPDVIFEVQEDNVGNDMDADMVGLSADFIVGSGSTTTGKSAMELDSSSTAAAPGGPCRILGVSNKEDNALGTYCKWDILFTEHELRQTADV